MVPNELGTHALEATVATPVAAELAAPAAIDDKIEIVTPRRQRRRSVYLAGGWWAL